MVPAVPVSHGAPAALAAQEVWHAEGMVAFQLAVAGEPDARLGFCGLAVRWSVAVAFLE